MPDMENRRQPAVLILVIIAVVAVNAAMLAIVLGPVLRDNDSRPQAADRSKAVGGGENNEDTRQSPTADQPEPLPTMEPAADEDPPLQPNPEPEPETQPTSLPLNWNELSDAEKITLNPFDCDTETQNILADDGSCRDKPRSDDHPPQPLPPEPERPPPTPTSPDELTLGVALAIFRRQLTNKGLETLEDVKFEVHAYGCRDSTNNAIGGCWVNDTRIMYLNDDNFPDNYALWSETDKLNTVRHVVDVLAHESFHAIEGGLLGTTIYSCHLGSSQSSANEEFSFAEQLDIQVETCLHQDPTWGAITKTLKDVYQGQLLSSSPDLPPGWGPTEAIKEFSASWYIEFYAELPTYAALLPAVLENYYDLYFKDRSEFAAAMRNIFDFQNNLLSENSLCVNDTACIIQT